MIPITDRRAAKLPAAFSGPLDGDTLPADDGYDQPETSLATAFADVDELPQEYVWNGRIGVAQINLIVAPGGTSKGVLVYDLGARITQGRALPGDEPEPPGNVIIASVEDGASEAIKPRLRVAGADMRRVYNLSTIDGEDFELPAHIGALRRTIDEIGGCRLVILDPLASISSVGLSSVVRVKALYKLIRREAVTYGFGTALTHHTTKEGSVAGSAAVVNGARSVLMVTRDPADEAVRVVTVYKTNGKPAPPLRYRLLESPDGFPYIEYLTESDTAAPQNERERVREVLDLAGGRYLTLQEIAAKSGVMYNSVRSYVSRLVAAGEARSEFRGLYSAAPTVATTPAGRVPAGQ